MTGSYHDYQDGDVTCEAYVTGVIPGEARPCVLVGHTWAGQSDHERGTADRLAALGYVGVAIDVYGKGRRGEHGTPTAMAANTALMTPFMQDRAMLRDRLLAAVAFAQGLDGVDAGRIAVMGYCFGGLCALDVARSGTGAVKGAVSIHGVFSPPAIGTQDKIAVKILILHGWEDPMAKPEDVLTVASELTAAGADWQLHAYGHAMHAFTAPGANMPEFGLQYSESATRRSWQATENFLAEVFA